MAVIFFPLATLVSIFYCMFYYTKPFYERQSTMLCINVFLLTNTCKITLLRVQIKHCIRNKVKSTSQMNTHIPGSKIMLNNPMHNYLEKYRMRPILHLNSFFLSTAISNSLAFSLASFTTYSKN